MPKVDDTLPWATRLSHSPVTGIDGAAVERCRQVIDGLREELYIKLRDLETPVLDLVEARL